MNAAATKATIDKSVWRPRLVILTDLVPAVTGEDLEAVCAEITTLVADLLAQYDLTAELGKVFSKSRKVGGRWMSHKLQRVDFHQGDRVVRTVDVPAGPVDYCRALAMLRVG